MSLKLPEKIAVELDYRYLDNPVVYTFPRLQKRDADVDEKERMLGNGKRMKSSMRLALLVDDIQGFENLGLYPRGVKFENESLVIVNEPEDEYRQRVERFFASDDGEELAEHALLYRVAAATPRSTFRSPEGDGLAEYIRGKEAAGPVAALPDVRAANPGPPEGVPQVPADAGAGHAQEADQG